MQPGSRATTIRVDAALKAEIDRLQAELTLDAGERVSHNELLRRLVALGRRHRRELVGKPPWKPLTRRQVEVAKRRAVRTGVRTSSEDIDRVLYGGDA